MNQSTNAFSIAEPPPEAGSATGDQIARLDPAQRAAAARQAEIMGAIGQGLAGLPLAQRRSALDHIAPMLIARGLPAAAMAAFQPTDRNLAAVVSEAGALGGLLAKTEAAPSPPAGA